MLLPHPIRFRTPRIPRTQDFPAVANYYCEGSARGCKPLTVSFRSDRPPALKEWTVVEWPGTSIGCASLRANLDVGSGLRQKPKGYRELSRRCPACLQIPTEEPIEERLGELAIVCDLLVEPEVRFDEVLQPIVDNLIESQAGVFGRIDPNTGLKGHVSSKFPFQLLYEDLVILLEIRAEALVELPDNL